MNQNIEQLVNKVLAAEKLTSPPISAERLAEFYFGLDIEWARLPEDNVAAALSVAKKKIYLNELAANVGLRNFTIAHELGHWVLHRDLIGKHSKQIEREADRFATCLLMPEKWVREEFAKLTAWSPADMKVGSLARKFCVSRTAMKIRLSQWELKLMYVDFRDYSCYQSKEDFLEKKAGQMRLF